jgi:hypothetical protein
VPFIPPDRARPKDRAISAANRISIIDRVANPLSSVNVRRLSAYLLTRVVGDGDRRANDEHHHWDEFINRAGCLSHEKDLEKPPPPSKRKEEE